MNKKELSMMDGVVAQAAQPRRAPEKIRARLSQSSVAFQALGSGNGL